MKHIPVILNHLIGGGDPVYPEWHIQDDVLKYINGRNVPFRTLDGVEHIAPNKWDILLAFPPCTYLTNAAACRLYPRKGELDIDRYQKGLKAKAFFLKLLNADCEHIAIENPVSSKIFQMPPHTQEIQPYLFDPDGIHPYTKKTRLWLKGLPLLISTTPNATPIGPYIPSCTSRKDRSKYGASKNDAKNRSKTFPGVAVAMAEQWAGKV